MNLINRKRKEIPLTPTLSQREREEKRSLKEYDSPGLRLLPRFMGSKREILFRGILSVPSPPEEERELLPSHPDNDAKPFSHFTFSK
jgi:hypothetical protein